TTAYGSTTANQSMGSGTTSVGVSATLTGLTASTTYHFRLNCSNSVGSSLGSDASFTTSASGGTGVCGSTAAPPATYDHIVIFSMENRTWSNVGMGFSATTMPYLHSLATQCSYFSDWTETNTSQNSLTQYIGETSGVNNPATVNDCTPSTT